MPMFVMGMALFSPITTSVNAVTTAETNPDTGANYTQAEADAANAAAAENSPGAGAKIARPTGAPDNLGKMFTQIANVALYIIGAVSVLMLIYGGIRYTVSAGDSAAVTAAKSTIMYAVIGVVVALLAYAIVNFVLVSITGTPAAS